MQPLLLPLVLAFVSLSTAIPQQTERIAHTCADPYKAVYCCQTVIESGPVWGLFEAERCGRINVPGAFCRSWALCCPDYGASYVSEYQDCEATEQRLIVLDGNFVQPESAIV